MPDTDIRQIEEAQGLSVVSGRDKLRFFTARATVSEMTDETLEDARVAQVIRSAMYMPMVMDGEPTKLHVTAWLCHQGKNNNNLVFRAQDLEPAAAKIVSPNLLPMDWNHSAVIPQEGVPKAIGVWYGAEAKYDPGAYEGRGALGIEAKGIVWAWAFPEYATAMLNAQREAGYIDFSMACIPTDVERGRDENGPYEIAIEPVFFTLSALNLPPGDPDAQGTIENESDFPVEPKQVLREPELVPDWARASAESQGGTDEATERETASAAALKKEDTMDHDKDVAKAALEAALEANAVLKAELEQGNRVREDMVAKVTELEDKVSALTIRAEEAELKRDALQAELAAASEQVIAMSAELETARAQLAEIAVEQEQLAIAQRWIERFAELPESYRAALAKRDSDEQARFTSRWSVASDEVWQEFKSDLFVGFADVKISYLKLSQEEGSLPVGSVGDLSAAVSALIK